ncbi:MAG TPA: ubiquinone/menaquinone biosynthesis methyltransferase [Acidimicrobiales bacterium]|nr:ubiquinone/menaquinone biosynthesis methyltransferase [Acidimicrobiales bacterium]
MTLPQGAEKARAVRSMFDAIAPRYDLVNRVMTFRMDVGWRRRTIRELALPRGARVLDLACGTGDFCRELLQRDLVPIGVDFSWGMLAAARTDAPLIQGDALCLPVPRRAVDGVTCGFALRNFVELEPFFTELARVVRPEGRIALLEVAAPANSILRTGHRVYFGKVVPLIGKLLSDGAAYRYLPKSVAYLPAPDAMLRMIEAAGFRDVRRILLSGGITQLIVGSRA